MSTVKISQLSEITHLNSNTANTLLVGVDIPSDVTGKITATTLAEGLYSYNPLNVGTNPIILPNTVAQFASSSNNYIQTNLTNQDNDGTADYVVTANTGTDTSSYATFGFTNSNYNPSNPYNSLGTSIEPLDGYLYVQGGVAGGNLVIGTTSSNTEIRFIAGGSGVDNVTAKVTSTGLNITETKYLTFGDLTKQTTAAASNAYSQASFALANTNATNIVTANTYLKANDFVTLTAAKGYTDSSNTSMKSYVDTANTSLKSYSDNKFLANSSGTFAGDLTITGNTTINNFVNIFKSNFDANMPLVHIIASDTGAYVAPSNSYYMMHITGKANNATRFVLDSFGANTYPLVSGRMGRGSAESPVASANNDVLMRIVGNGYTGTQFPTSSPTKIDFVATENFSNTNRGTAIQFWNTPNGSNTIQKIATFNANEVSFTGVVSPQKGFIFTPKVLNGAQTAITIDFSSDSTIKATCNADVTMILNNYTAGKIVEVWLTNTGAQNRTITHGCASLNSTTKTTSFTLSATSSAYMRYFSIDGDNANTFVTITA